MKFNPGMMAKAITAALGTAYLAWQAATVLESPGGIGVTQNEWVGIAFGAAIVGFTVWAVPNDDKGKITN